MKILIGTPSTRGLFTAGFTASLMRTGITLNKLGATVEHSIVTQALVSKSRDILASQAIRGEYDYLWMIDDDMQWDASTFQMFYSLMMRKCPIVAVAAPAREFAATNHPEACVASYPLRFPARFIEKSERLVDSVFAGESKIRIREALTIGTGFMAVRTSVFNTLRQYSLSDSLKARGDLRSEYAEDDDLKEPILKPYLANQDNPECWRFFEERMVKTDDGRNTLLGEDESFVALAREWAKAPTIVPVDAHIGHEGMHRFQGRVSDHWDATLQAGS